MKGVKMIEEDEDIIKLRLYIQKSSNYKELDNILDDLEKIIESLTHKERQLQYEYLADTMSDFLVKGNLENIKNINQLTDLIEKIFVAIEENENIQKPSVALVKFLYILQEKNYESLDIELYKNLMDVVNDINWIFELKQSEKQFVFSIHELISKVVKNFEYSDDNLMHLTMALQIFKNFDNGNNKDQIEGIAKEYKIGILLCLLEGGSILNNSSENYNFNGTLIVKNNKYAIIRNKDKSYFDDIDTKYNVLAEINKNKQEMAYYIEVEIEQEYITTSFQKIFEENNNNVKIELLKEIFETESYNVFFNDSIIIHSTTREFIRMLNPSRKDRKIIGNSANEINNFDGFYKILKKNEIPNARHSVIYGNYEKSCDIVTLDFAIEIMYVFKMKDYQYNMFSKNYDGNDDFRQNQIIKEFFENVIYKEEISVEKKIDMLIAYYKYLYNNYKYNKNTQMSEIISLVMPFKPYNPFECSTKKEALYKFVEVVKSSNDLNDELSIIQIKKIDDKIGNINVLDLEQNELDIQEDEIENLFFSFADREMYAVFDNKNKKIIHDYEINEVCKYIGNYFKDLDFVKFEDKNKIDIRLIDMLQIINAFRSNEMIWKKFNCDTNINSIYILKLIWHFNIFNIFDEKINEFYKLIFEFHYTDMIRKCDNKDKLLDNLKQYCERKGVLVIAKETAGDCGTLYSICKNVCDDRYLSERNFLIEIFDASMIQSNIKEKNGKYYYDDNLIEEIVFVTDIILSGKATETMLNYHLNVTPINNINRKYLQFREENYISNIIKANGIEEKISVYSLFKFQEVNEFIINNKKIKIIHENEIEKMYKDDDCVKDIYIKIYNDKMNSEDVVRVIRYNNMPFKTIFMKEIVDSKYLIGIFNRKEEL